MDQAYRHLLQIYRERLRDRKQATTRRRRKVEAAPRSLSQLVSEYFGADKEALRKIEETRALQAWPQIVGEAAAQASRAERVRGHQLVVRVRDPLWMHQLYLMKRELVQRYRESFPSLGLDDIYFKRGGV